MLKQKDKLHIDLYFAQLSWCKFWKAFAFQEQFYVFKEHTA